MIDVAFDATDRQLAMRTANAIADRYVSNQVALRSHSAQRTSAWLSERVAELQSRVEAAENRRREISRAGGPVLHPGRFALLLKQMTDLSAELASTRPPGPPSKPISNSSTQRLAARAAPSSSSSIRPHEDPGLRRGRCAAEARRSLGIDGRQASGDGRLSERLRHVRAARQSEGLRVIASLENDLKVARLKEQDLGGRLHNLQDDVRA